MVVMVILEIQELRSPLMVNLAKRVNMSLAGQVELLETVILELNPHLMAAMVAGVVKVEIVKVEKGAEVVMVLTSLAVSLEMVVQVVQVAMEQVVQVALVDMAEMHFLATVNTTDLVEMLVMVVKVVVAGVTKVVMVEQEVMVPQSEQVVKGGLKVVVLKGVVGPKGTLERGILPDALARMVRRVDFGMEQLVRVAQMVRKNRKGPVV